MRLVQNFNSCFGIVDDNIVVLFQLHPQDNDCILSVVKIWDAGLAKNLGKEFELFWNGGEDLISDMLLKCKVFSPLKTAKM